MDKENVFFFYKHNAFEHTEAQKPLKTNHILNVSPVGRSYDQKKYFACLGYHRLVCEEKSERI